MATKFWGPLGWMTLHSISAIYPENPTPEDKLLLDKFIENFRESITCVHCKGHFTSMLNTYRRKHYDWNASRYNLLLFVCRAHNTVNRRLDKPILPTLQSCIDRLREVEKVTPLSSYRTAYINYLMQNWSREGTGEAFMFLSCAKTLLKINNEYFNIRDEGVANLSFRTDADVTEFIEEDPRRYNVGSDKPNAATFTPTMRIGLVGGVFRIRK